MLASVIVAAVLQFSSFAVSHISPAIRMAFRSSAFSSFSLILIWWGWGFWCFGFYPGSLLVPQSPRVVFVALNVFFKRAFRLSTPLINTWRRLVISVLVHFRLLLLGLVFSACFTASTYVTVGWDILIAISLRAFCFSELRVLKGLVASNKLRSRIFSTNFSFCSKGSAASSLRVRSLSARILFIKSVTTLLLQL